MDREEYQREYGKKWRVENKAKIKKASKKHYQDNKEKYAELARNRYAANPELRKRILQRIAKTRQKPEAKEKARWKRILKKYGITKEQWEKMYHDQDGRCYICQRTEQQIKKSKSKFLVVDHDHTTGKIRGLLCSFCNRTVLTCIRESAERAKRLLTYLTRETGYGTTPDKD